MTFNFKKMTIYGVIAVFLVSAVMCCCLGKTVEAVEPVSSCHQTSQDANSSENAKECECDQSLTLIEKGAFPYKSLLQNFSMVPGQNAGSSTLVFVKAAVNHPPPLLYDFSPLSINNSILRV